MKVHVAGYQAISILHGGPNTQLLNTVRHLAEFGVDAALFDPWSPFKKDSCDIFHVFAANIGTFHLAREIHLLGIPMAVSPIVYSRHSPAFVRRALSATRLVQRAGLGIWSDYALCADICSWGKGVLPNTRAEAELVIEGFGVAPDVVSVIPNGVDPRFYEADPAPFKKQYGVDNFILNVGHIGHGRKNVLSLIKALGAIDYPSVIIGRVISGAYGDACLAEAARHKQILLIDGLDNNSEMLASAYAACDTFVLPSLFETPGIAALEAGLAGAKIVITGHGGTREYFGDDAVYVDPASISSIRDGIVKSLQKKKSDALREHIRRNFLWRHVAEKTAAAYRRLLAEGRV